MKIPHQWLIGMALGCAPMLLGAQGSSRSPNLPPGAFKAPTHAQLHRCYIEELTRNLHLDSTQQMQVVLIINTFHDSKPTPRNVSEWLPRVAVRDSSIRAILKTKADSETFENNLKRERQWFDSGICHG